MHIETLLKKAQKTGLPNDGLLLLVDVCLQHLHIYNTKKEILGHYPVSTARRGLGNREQSLQTPGGLHEIVEQYGDGQAEGVVFKSRRVVQDMKNKKDLILTRILRLSGLETFNKNTYHRMIYIHGTPHEAQLGTPASQGCIRMHNHDSIKLFNLLKNKTAYCWIGEIEK